MRYRSGNDKRVNFDKAKSIADIQNNRCMYCGRVLKITPENRSDRGIDNWNVEHFVPKAVLKWVADYLNEEEFDDLCKMINSDDNLGIACCVCNTYKNETISEESEIDKMFTSQEKKDGYKDIFKRSEVFRETYETLKEELLEKQHGRCAGCGIKISDIEQCNIR